MGKYLMRIAVVSWLKGKSIPVKGYGGIERMAGIMSKELAKSNQVHLIAPTGSRMEEVEIWECDELRKVEEILNRIEPDIVWDNTCWDHASPARTMKWPCVSTTHVNHAVGWSKNVIYLSESQKTSHGQQLGKTLDNPVIHVPMNPAFVPKGLKREDYLLFLGSVTPWKGVLESAQFAQKLGRELWVAGPAWGEYADRVASYPNVKMLGEVDGWHKEQLLEQAYAVMCLHNDGGIDWKEPGCGVVMEAGAFGTPVFASYNGCLAELVSNGFNGWAANTQEELLEKYKKYECDPIVTRNFTELFFSAQHITEQYLEIFKEVIDGKTYGN